MAQTFKAGLIRVVTLEDAALRELHGKLIQQYCPALRVETKSIPDQPEGIHSEETKALAVPKIIELARSFREIDVLIISCCDDPAVQELGEQLPIPVVGAGSATAALARRYGRNVGILGITDYAPQPYQELLGENLVNLGRPEGVNGTLDLLTPQGRQSCFDKAAELKAAGARSIALACTGMSTIGLTAPLEQACGLPVVDPVLAEGLMAYYECLRTTMQ